jgi:signal transduction histidine kinase
MVKVFVYYAIVILFFVIGLFVVRWLRGHRYQFTFRDKLLAALLATALIPLIIMATYARQLARERLLDSTASRLEQETATLNVSIEQRLQGEEGIVQEALSRDEIDRLANEARTDFNLYVGNQLQASSRPELYDAGVLDKRLSGLAFANTVLKGKRFYLQTETIGSYQYAVGYRPLVSGAGRIAGIVAVPTLYRIEEVEEEVSRRNALIFGMYAIVVFAIVVIATTFANRIAAPIHKLTMATKRVARGDLNVTVGVQRADGEIGGLIRSFEAMTKELARSREDLVRFERELAWKEMAKQVAHEIKNPLTPMKLSMQHLRQTYKDRVSNFEHVFDEVSKTIIEQIDTLSRIASEFASFARMPKPILETVDVNAALRESVLLFEQDATIRFELVLEDNLPPVKSDREELRRAFINIIRNGVQAMDNSGQMTVRSRSEHGKAIVTLRDEGVGMSEEVKARLFQPNFSTKTDGMGLGLAITKKIIDDLGGSIIIDSTEGKGTTVTIILPVEQ